jgi:hypothetical protein
MTAEILKFPIRRARRSGRLYRLRKVCRIGERTEYFVASRGNAGVLLCRAHVVRPTAEVVVVFLVDNHATVFTHCSRRVGRSDYVEVAEAIKIRDRMAAADADAPF